MMHPSFSALMAPPDLSGVVYAQPKWIQRLSQWIDTFASVPILQKSWMQYCQRVAWTDAISTAEWASCRTCLGASYIKLGLPSVLVLTTHRSALVTAAEPPHLPCAATGQLLTVNATVLGGMQLCIDGIDGNSSFTNPRCGRGPRLRCLAQSGQPDLLHTLMAGLASH